jgi:diadenosine tetraphosphate (Ap4A) HIT family hydrolase
MDCIFCERIRAGEVLTQNETAVAFADAFPLSPGHVLIVARRHEADLFALSAVEQDALWALLRDIRNGIEQSHHPDGYNIGVNIGAAGGQTVGHVHVHVIPRYTGDVDEPREGIRWIIPAKARYWER